MMLTAAEWAKFGEFIRLRGAVQTADGSLKQIIRPDLIEELMKPSKANPVYGMTWWLPGTGGDTGIADGDLMARLLRQQMAPITDQDGKPVRIWMAAGLGKQRLLILPDHDTVIIRYAEATPGGLAYEDMELISRIMGWK
jgi:CubicO group peptidase (beta-lactamase class C family)